MPISNGHYVISFLQQDYSYAMRHCILDSISVLSGVPDDSGLPHIPSPPRSGGVTPQGGPPGGGNDDVDLDDLTRRFEELKKRK